MSPAQTLSPRKPRPARDPPSDWALIFDCETRATPDQRLRFGAYQLRNKGRLFELGFFYGPEVLTDPGGLRVLEQEKTSSKRNLMGSGFVFSPGSDSSKRCCLAPGAT
jgi:hypothetical protein